jgi:hypothetical protein
MIKKIFSINDVKSFFENITSKEYLYVFVKKKKDDKFVFKYIPQCYDFSETCFYLLNCDTNIIEVVHYIDMEQILYMDSSDTVTCYIVSV